MSIRRKLLLSNIAMIAVPVFVFAFTAFFLVNAFFPEAGWIGRNAPGVGRFPDEAFAKSGELFIGMKYMIDYNPDIAANMSFLQQSEEKLNVLEAAIAVEKDGRLIYSSPMLGSAPDLANTEQGFRNTISIHGKSFTVQAYEFLYSDNSSGKLYFLENIDRMKRLARSMFPLMFLSLLLVIALTNGVLTYFVSRSILKPLHELRLGIERIKEGNLDHPLKPGRRDEIGQLGYAFEEMRQRLRQSILTQLQYEENRKELLSNISHDLKTPITAIAGCVDGLRDGIADTPEKRKKYLDMIYKKVSDMDNLIDDLFLFSKLDLKKLPFQFETVDMNAYLQECAEEYRHDPALQTKGVSFLYESPGPVPVYVTADRDKLRRVIANIVQNSLKNMDKSNREIRFRLLDGNDTDEITVAISDNGRGIDSDALSHIFERFYRVDPSRSRDTGGSGLGLAIVKQIIGEHGGRVWAHSTAGAGTEILFTLRKEEERGR